MYKKIYKMLAETGKIKSAVILTGENMGSRTVFKDGRCLVHGQAEEIWADYVDEIGKTDETKVIQVGNIEIFVEIFQKNPRMILLGAGHVSCPVAKIGKMLGFHVMVMDDREEFLNRERFPDADELLLGNFEELSQKIPPYENDYYIVVTRGHQGDTVCARQILKRPYMYFGMIGSKNKVKLTRETLLKEGFSKEALDTIYAPIGLPIGGQLPQEIAVSIIAQVVQVKNKNYSAFIDDNIAEAVCRGLHGVMATIINKTGSSPRGIGSKMFISRGNGLYGSIGGGSVEYEVVKEAENIDGCMRRYYNLSISDDKNLGMICGGNVEILFEEI